MLGNRFSRSSTLRLSNTPLIGRLARLGSSSTIDRFAVALDLLQRLGQRRALEHQPVVFPGSGRVGIDGDRLLQPVLPHIDLLARHQLNTERLAVGWRRSR